MNVLFHIIFIAALWGNFAYVADNLKQKMYDVTIVGKYTTEAKHDGVGSEDAAFIEGRFENQHVKAFKVTINEYLAYKVGDVIKKEATSKDVYGQIPGKEVYAWASLFLAGVVTILYFFVLIGGKGGGAVLDGIGDIFD